MSKNRKTSPSPAYFNNQENTNLQNLTFKNMYHNKRSNNQENNQSPSVLTNLCSIYTDSSLKDDREDKIINTDRILPYKNRGQSPFFAKDEKKNIKNQQQYLAIIKSKQKQISSLNGQAKALSNTVELLQFQIQSLTKENRAIMANPMKKIQQKQQQNEKLIKQKSDLRKELKEFEQIVPKLNELESIQNMLIEQNRKYKVKQQSMKVLLKNIKNVISQQPCQLSQKLNHLILNYFY